MRKTALILLLIAAGGAAFVIVDYRRTLKAQEESGRPPHVARLESNFAAVRHDKQAVAFDELDGKIWFLATVCLSQSGEGEQNLRVLQAVSEKYADRKDLHFVCMTVDPDVDVPEKMAAFAERLGLADNPRWWFIGAGEKPTRRFLKDKLKFGAVTETTVDGESVVVFNSVLGILDPNRNLRGRYDFAKALEVQEEIRALLEEDPAAYDELTDKQKAVIDQGRDAMESLTKHFFEALDYIIREKDGTLPEQT